MERQLQENPDIHTVFITSPTYDGVVSDVRAIARAAHRHHAVLIVDEAHGAHFGMHPLFPDSSVHLGADLVIHSLHKTLPSLTQTALLHVNGDRVDRNKIRRLLDVYETSSPSYVLMASMDQCVRLLQQKGPELFEAYAGMLSRFDSLTGNLRVLKRIKTDDPSKIIIACPSGEMSGPQMAASLRNRFHIEPEMVTPEYVLCLSGIGDDEEGLVRLEEAMADIDEELFIHKQFRTADITGDDPATFTSGCRMRGGLPRRLRHPVCLKTGFRSVLWKFQKPGICRGRKRNIHRFPPVPAGFHANLPICIRREYRW